MGQLLVRDDGTSQENYYCKPNVDGIATASNHGYRVLKRISQNQILALVSQFYRKPSDNSVEQLEKLARLKEEGSLNEEEFRIEKQKLLYL